MVHRTGSRPAPPLQCCFTHFYWKLLDVKEDIRTLSEEKKKKMEASNWSSSDSFSAVIDGSL